MKIHYGIYDTHLNEWVTKPLELDQAQLIQMRQVVARMNRAHDLLPDEFKMYGIGTPEQVRYHIHTRIVL